MPGLFHMQVEQMGGGGAKYTVAPWQDTSGQTSNSFISITAVDSMFCTTTLSYMPDIDTDILDFQYIYVALLYYI